MAVLFVMLCTTKRAMLSGRGKEKEAVNNGNRTLQYILDNFGYLL